MSVILELMQAVGLGLVTLLPLANPLTSVVLFLSLSGHMTQVERDRQMKMASIYVFIIMIVTFYGGQIIMNSFGISIPGLRIAGGLIVAFIGFRMLFPQQSLEESSVVEKKSEEIRNYQSKDIAFVPLAMPGTAGPGTIAMIISYSSTVKTSGIQFSPWVFWGAPLITSATIGLILWVCLRSSASIVRWIGGSSIEAISRVMGFLLVCMGVQFGINGILEIIRTYPSVS